MFQHNPEGVVSVKFKTEEGADECTRVMNGRFFAGRQLEAFKWDGVTNYNVKVCAWNMVAFSISRHVLVWGLAACCTVVLVDKVGCCQAEATG